MGEYTHGWARGTMPRKRCPALSTATRPVRKLAIDCKICYTSARTKHATIDGFVEFVSGEADMTLLRCPGCHNMVARESVRCPVCGCKFTAAAIRHWTKWVIVVLCALWLLNRRVIRRFTAPAHPQHSRVVLHIEAARL